MNGKYFVDFGTGAGNFYADTIEEAQERADKEAEYTQESIVIYCGDKEVSRRQWYGTEYDEEVPEENPITFGSFGFYADWT